MNKLRSPQDRDHTQKTFFRTSKSFFFFFENFFQDEVLLFFTDKDKNVCRRCRVSQRHHCSSLIIGRAKGVSPTASPCHTHWGTCSVDSPQEQGWCPWTIIIMIHWLKTLTLYYSQIHILHLVTFQDKRVCVRLIYPCKHINLDTLTYIILV